MYICRLFISNNNLESELNANYCNLKIVNIDEYTPGRALNLGVKNCSFNNVIILSSHCSIIKFNKSTIQKNLDNLWCFIWEPDSILLWEKNPKTLYLE